ncbi:MAG: CoA-transferase [Pseudorhodoplanes sp.]|uniref:CoA-transferase n=1 Tax=Pseudorhodoplanes sp. TaxID=1934341 RepID=UPI003D1510E8
MTDASLFEQMLLTGAKRIKDGSVLFVGFHWPMLMTRIARRLHAPDIVVIYENGIVEDRLTSVLPTSPSDLTAAEGAAACAGSLESLFMWLASGRVQMTLLEAVIADRFGNINTTAIGPYEKPTVRLPGSGGGTELASMGHGLMLVSASTAARSYPERVDYNTSPGYLAGRQRRTGLGYDPATGPQCLVNPFGVFEYDQNGEMYAAALHTGLSAKTVQSAFAWPIRAELATELPGPSVDDLRIVREEIENARKRLYVLPASA